MNNYLFIILSIFIIIVLLLNQYVEKFISPIDFYNEDGEKEVVYRIPYTFTPIEKHIKFNVIDSNKNISDPMINNITRIQIPIFFFNI